MDVLDARNGPPPTTNRIGNPPTFSQTWARLLNLLELIMTRLQVRERSRKLHVLALQYPIPAFVILMVMAMCSVPVLIFIIFAVVSVSVTFMSFVCFEGVLLTIGVVVLGGSFIVLSIVAVVLSGVMLGAACMLVGTQRVLTYLQKHRSTWTHNAQGMCDYCMSYLPPAFTSFISRQSLSDHTPDPSGHAPRSTIVNCCIAGCPYSKAKCRGLSFCYFPQKSEDPEREKWRKKLLACVKGASKGFDPVTESICNRHFKAEEFLPHAGGWRLKVGSLPTKFLPRKPVRTPQASPWEEPTNGSEILWKHIVESYRQEQPPERDKTSPLTVSSAQLSPFSVLGVKLAAQVLSKRVATVMKENGGPEYQQESAKLQLLMNHFFEFLNVRFVTEGCATKKTGHVQCKAVDYDKFLLLENEFLDYLRRWKHSIKQRPDPCTMAEHDNMFLPPQTSGGRQMTACAFRNKKIPPEQWYQVRSQPCFQSSSPGAALQISED